MSGYTTISTSVDDGVMTLLLDRPDNLNAFTVEMADELEHCFRAVNDDDSVRAVIVTGSGRAFCAGMDLSTEGNVFGLDESKTPSLADMDDLDDPELAGVRDTGGRVTLAITDCRKPVIAAVNGPAVGIGATMTLGMDARLVSTKARIGFVFGKIAVTPEACSSWYLPRIVGLPTALDLVYSADIIDGAEAERIGLARSLHEPDELLTAARALADRWTLGKSPVSLALSRQLLLRNQAIDDPADAHRVDSLAMFYTSIGDGKEGVQAFLDKRPAEFTSTASAMPAFFDEWLSRD